MGTWDHNLPLVKFAYNNNYITSISITLFEALHGKRYRLPTSRDKVGEKKPFKVELID